jgi:hypothetical protein
MTLFAFILRPPANSSSIPLFLVDPAAVVIEQMAQKPLDESSIPHPLKNSVRLARDMVHFRFLIGERQVRQL